MSAEDALLKIQELLSGEAWTPDTLMEVAHIMEDAGYKIDDLD